MALTHPEGFELGAPQTTANPLRLEEGGEPRCALHTRARHAQETPDRARAWRDSRVTCLERPAELPKSSLILRRINDQLTSHQRASSAGPESPGLTTSLATLLVVRGRRIATFAGFAGRRRRTSS